MGTNTLSTKTDGQIISSGDVNQYKTALNENFVPRNSSGIATDLGGDLGTTTYGWDSAYVDEYVVGDPTNNLVMKQNLSGQLSFNTGGTERFVIDANGADGAGLKASSVTTAKIADANVTTAKIADANVTTAKIADNNVTNAKIGTGAVTNLKIAGQTITGAKMVNQTVTETQIGLQAVTESRIAISAVTESRIANLSVTPAKKSVNYLFSSSSGTFSTSSTSDTNITNLNATLTVSGRALRFEVLPDYTTSTSEIYVYDSGTSSAMFVTLYRDTTKIDEIKLESGIDEGYFSNVVFVTGNETEISTPYYIKVRVSSSGETAYFNYVRLVVTYM